MPSTNHSRESEIHAFILLLILTNGLALKRSSLIRKLLRGYERLPPAGQGSVTVELGIYINYFYDISDLTMDYSVSMYLRQQWFDERLSFNKTENNNNSRIKIEDIHQLWIPDIFIRNEKSAYFHEITTDNNLLYIYSNGQLWYVSKITAVLSCPMRLQKFPMDTQHCSMLFESFGYSSDEVVLKWIDPKENAVEFDDTSKDMPQFDLDDIDLHNCSYNGSKEDGHFNYYPCLEVTFTLSRSLGYFLIQYYIPSVLLVILSWVGFWISVDAVVARVSIGLLTVLNLTMQSTGSRNVLPQVSYIKAIDVWMSVCLAFAFASLLEFAIVNVWSRKEIKRRNSSSNSTQPFMRKKLKEPEKSKLKRREKAKEEKEIGKTKSIEMEEGMKSIEEKEQRMKPNEIESLEVPNNDEQVTGDHTLVRKVSLVLRRRLSLQLMEQRIKTAQTIDGLSRKIFPISFFSFNIVYWLSYLIKKT